MTKSREYERYGKLLADPRWRAKREEVFAERGSRECENCGETKGVHVHHGYYEYGRKPWEYEIESLHVYCEDCHAKADHLRRWTRWLLGRLGLVDLRRVGYYAMGVLNADPPNTPLPALETCEGLDGFANAFGLTGEELQKLMDDTLGAEVGDADDRSREVRGLPLRGKPWRSYREKGGKR